MFDFVVQVAIFESRDWINRFCKLKFFYLVWIGMLCYGLLLSMIFSHFPMNNKILGIFQIIIKILATHWNIDVIIKIDCSYSCSESATVNKNTTHGTRNNIGGMRYSDVFKLNVRVGFGFNGKKPIVWQNLWTHLNIFISNDARLTLAVKLINSTRNRFTYSLFVQNENSYRKNMELYLLTR